MKLPRKLSCEDCVKILVKKGFIIKKHSRKHYVLTRNEGDDDPEFRFVVVPRHKSLALGTLNNIIRGSGMTKEEFFDLA